MVGYHFFGSDDLFYEKEPCGVFLCGHSDSLNMNDTELTFIGVVKLNIERPSFGNEPLLSEVRKTYEFGLVFDELQRVFVTLFGLVKMKRGTHDGEIKGRESVHFANKMAICCHL